MTSKKDLLRKTGLYLVTDAIGGKDKDILEVIGRSLEAGIDMVQLRDKDADYKDFVGIGKKAKALTDRKNAILIVNDRIDEALALDADGIHIGQDDIAVPEARKRIPGDKIIGLSTHSEQQLTDALSAEIDYLSVGPVFATDTKPDYEPTGLALVSAAREKSDLPFVAIGGINKSNIDKVFQAGARRIAMVRAIIDNPDPFQAVKQLLGLINDPDRIR